MPGASLSPDNAPWIYHFTHANVFHLLANLSVLASFWPGWGTAIKSYLIASACAYVPVAAISAPTCGLSGLIFAAAGLLNGSQRVNFYKTVLLILVMAPMPNVNWRIHLLCFLFGFFQGMIEAPFINKK